MSQTQVAKTDAKPVTFVEQVCNNITVSEKLLHAALPPHIDVKKFMRVAITAIQHSPDLQRIANASPAARASIHTACSKAAADGLLPDGREGAIVAFNKKVSPKGAPDKWEPHAQWMPMVEGLRKMVRNSGDISTISVQVVHEKDLFDYELGDHEFLKHKPALKARGPIIGAYSIAKLKDGEVSREYMDIEQIQAVRERSKSKDSGPWKTDFSEMCRKTVFRRHYKSLPKSTDLDNVIDNDDDFGDPSVSAYEASRPAPVKREIGHNPETGEVDFENTVENQPAAKPAAKRTSSRAAAAMKQADAVEVKGQPAEKKTYTRGDSQPQNQAAEEVNFDGDDGRQHQEQQSGGYEEEEMDVV